MISFKAPRMTIKSTNNKQNKKGKQKRGMLLQETRRLLRAGES